MDRADESKKAHKADGNNATNKANEERRSR